MPLSGLSILIVDDAKFSSAVVRRTLAAAGYDDIRNESSASEALAAMEERAADIIIADWLMPEMDGLELTRRVRQLDEAVNRYTYVILLTAREGVAALQEAFEEGVDDFVYKSAMSEQLPHRIMAAERLVMLQNRILADNQRLIDANARLRRQSILDPLTGFGNRQYAVRRLDDAMRHARARGGAACLLLLRIEHLERLEKDKGKGMVQQMLLAFSRRLKQLVRPMDILARLAPDLFCVITHQPDMARCTPGSFRRLYDGLNHRAYKTTGGFSHLEVSISLIASGEGDKVEADYMLSRAIKALPESRDLGRVVEQPLQG